MSLASGDPRHGTLGGYSYHECRCEACTAANRAYFLEYRHRTGRSRPRAEYLADLARRAADNHGLSRYRYGCRCATCREAMRLYQADYRARKARNGVAREPLV